MILVHDVQMYNIFRLLIGVPDYSSSEPYGEKQKLIGFIVIISLFHRGVSVNHISHELIRYESSRGHKIDGTKRNLTGKTFGDKQGKQTEENGLESSQQRTSSR